MNLYACVCGQTLCAEPNTVYDCCKEKRAGQRLSWTQPICERCWIAREAAWEDVGEVEVLKEIRRPTVLTDSDLEQCAFCGEPTIMGIFVRHDPNDVPFTKEKNDG